MSGAEIAQEVLEGMLEAQEATGPASQAVILRQGADTGDAWNPAPGDDAPFDCTVIEAKFSQGDMARTLLADCDKKFLVAAADLAIEPGEQDELRVGSRRNEIMAVERIAPAGVPLLWKLYVKDVGPFEDA